MSIASVAHGYVFGIKNDIADNLFYLEENTILYPAGNNVIVANVEQKTQRFIPLSETGTGDGICAISVSPDKHVFAVAEQGDKPAIHIYDLHNFRKRRQLAPIEGSISKEYVSLCFSIDSKYLAAQLGAPDWILHYYAWEKGKPIATIQSSPSPDKDVSQVSINPYDGTEFCVTGQGFTTMYRYAEGVLRPLQLKLPAENYLTHCWITVDRLLLGSQEGNIYLIGNNQTLHIENFAPNGAVSTIQSMKQGFAAAGMGGSVCIYEFDTNDWSHFHCMKRIPLPQTDMIVTSMASTTSEGILLVEVDTNQIFKVSVSPSDLAKSETLQLEQFTQPYHHGPITGLDLCIRKPLLVTCGADKSIRMWNYLTGTCEMVKYFPEEAHSVALHPSGLYLLAGFNDKLRLMNLLMDDLRVVREFGIRACRECRFAHGGHAFAAAHGNIIQIFSTWTFDNIENLKGHNGKVKSLYWTPDDAGLVSAGSDGAVYTWNIRQMKREHEHILKSCSYNSATCSPNGKVVYAVGSDKYIKEITESATTKELESNVVMTQVVLSNSGRMMFVGTNSGCVRALKFPFNETQDFQEHQAHAGSVTKMRVSYDDQYLFSTSEDGTLYMFKIADKDERGLKKDKSTMFADEILITKSDMEEKTVLMAELQRNLDELKLEHEYQLRLKDMNFNEKLKEVTEKFSQEIEALKISTSVLRTEKEKEDVKHQEQLQNMKAAQIQELHEVEVKYNQQLMEEYDKYQTQQEKTSALQQEWQRQMRDFELSTQKQLGEIQSAAETRLNAKSLETQKLVEELRQQEREFEEMMTQNQHDIDTEILAITARYEKKLRSEREDGARLKGENGIMRKKFNTLNKDIEDNKSEIQRMKENAKKLEGIIAILEKDIQGLRKEMADRDEHIQDKERKVYDLKKRNQELEKYKFVLDFRIKELKEQVEPRENHIADMSRQIQEINNELKALSMEKQRLEDTIETFQKQLETTKIESVKEHRKVGNVVRYIKTFKTDLQDAMQYFQEPDVLTKMIHNLYERYCQGLAEKTGVGIDPMVKREYLKQHEKLKQRINDLRTAAESNSVMFRIENVHTMADNQRLIEEINDMRKNSKAKPLTTTTGIRVVAITRPSQVQETQTPGDSTRPNSKLPPIATPTAQVSPAHPARSLSIHH